MRHGALLFAVLLAGCAATNGSPAEGFSVPDVHGIAVSPSDPDVLFVASHHGLARVEGDSGAFVGDARDDYMGFSAHPTEPGTFWVSGHPRGGGNMGVRQTTDGGATWRTLWAEPVDFHAMTVSPADPQRLWGSFRGQLHQSDDGGTTWTTLPDAPPPLRALVAHPTDRDVVLATTNAGPAVRKDGAWSTLAGIPAYGLAFDPTSPSTLYAGGAESLWKSADAGVTWTPLHAPASGAFAYLSVSRTDPATVYAATYEAGVYRSDDAGATWREVLAPSR